MGPGIRPQGNERKAYFLGARHADPINPLGLCTYHVSAAAFHENFQEGGIRSSEESPNHANEACIALRGCMWKLLSLWNSVVSLADPRPALAWWKRRREPLCFRMCAIVQRVPGCSCEEPSTGFASEPDCRNGDTPGPACRLIRKQTRKLTQSAAEEGRDRNPPYSANEPAPDGRVGSVRRPMRLLFVDRRGSDLTALAPPPRWPTSTCSLVSRCHPHLSAAPSRMRLLRPRLQCSARSVGFGC